MPGRGIISSLRAGPPAGAFLFAFLQKPFRGTGWGLRAPTPAPTLSGKSRQKAAARRLRQKPLNAGLGRGDAQSAYFGQGWVCLCGWSYTVCVLIRAPNRRGFLPALAIAAVGSGAPGWEISSCAYGWGGWALWAALFRLAGANMKRRRIGFPVWKTDAPLLSMNALPGGGPGVYPWSFQGGYGESRGA